MPLESHQRKVFHVQGVALRNLPLETTPRCLTSFPSTRCRVLLRAKDSSTIIHESHIEPNTANPMWDGMDFSEVTATQKLDEFVVEVVSVGRQRTGTEGSGSSEAVGAKVSETVFMTESVHLPSLVRVCAEIDQLPQLPKLAVVIRLVDGIYTSPTNVTASKLPAPLHPLPRTLDSISLVDLLKGAAELSKSQREAGELRQSIGERRGRLADQTRSTFKRMEHTVTLTQLETRRDAMDKELKRIQLTIRSEEAGLERKRQSLIVRSNTLAALQRRVVANRQQLKDEHDRLRDDREQQERVRDILCQRQWEMVRKLSRIYPIDTETKRLNGLTSSLAIRQCLLPSVKTFKNMDTFSQELQEEFAAATGNVAHLVLLLSRYFQLPLQHPILYMSSRSSIFTNRLRDSLDFPLFERGMDRIMFNYGLYLLNTNVEQMIRELKIDIPDRDFGLLQLLQLIFTESDRVVRLCLIA